MFVAEISIAGLVKHYNWIIGEVSWTTTSGFMVCIYGTKEEIEFDEILHVFAAY